MPYTCFRLNFSTFVHVFSGMPYLHIFPFKHFSVWIAISTLLKVILLLPLLESLPRIPNILSITTAIIQKVDITITELNSSWSTFSKCSLAPHPWDRFSEQLNCFHQGLVSFRVAWKKACCDYVQISMHIWLNQSASEEKIQKNWEHFRHLTVYQKLRLSVE